LRRGQAGKPDGPRIKLEQVATRVPAGLGMADSGSSTVPDICRILCLRLLLEPWLSV
jgi:hypothetical protein